MVPTVKLVSTMEEPSKGSNATLNPSPTHRRSITQSCSKDGANREVGVHYGRAVQRVRCHAESLTYMHTFIHSDMQCFTYTYTCWFSHLHCTLHSASPTYTHPLMQSCNPSPACIHSLIQSCNPSPAYTHPLMQSCNPPPASIHSFIHSLIQSCNMCLPLGSVQA